MGTKDYYEILGIRPNASDQEIELAYKGRRSQYHPDRYPDAEGNAWATEKMKDLNEAYAALTGTAGAARPSQQQADQRTRQQAASVRNPTPATLGEFLRQNPGSCFDSEKIFFHPSIPQKKLRGAIDSYGDGIASKDVRILIDDTVFGGAREGAIFTDSEVRFKEIFIDWHGNVLRAIKSMQMDGLTLYIDDSKVMKFNMPKKSELRSLCKTLNQFFSESGTTKLDEPSSAKDPFNTKNPTPRGGIDARSSVDGKSMFYSFQEGIFDSIRQSVYQTNSGTTNRVGEEIGKLCWTILDMAMGLPTWIRSNVFPLTEDEEKILSSDTIRFELLLFILACITSSLFEECGEEDAYDRITVIFMIVLMPYILHKEGLGGIGESMNPGQVMGKLQHSKMFPSAKRKMEGYQEIIGSCGDPASFFMDQFRAPTEFKLVDGESSLEMKKYILREIHQERLQPGITRYLVTTQARIAGVISHFVLVT